MASGKSSEQFDSRNFESSPMAVGNSLQPGWVFSRLHRVRQVPILPTYTSSDDVLLLIIILRIHSTDRISRKSINYLDFPLLIYLPGALLAILARPWASFRWRLATARTALGIDRHVGHLLRSGAFFMLNSSLTSSTSMLSSSVPAKYSFRSIMSRCRFFSLETHRRRNGKFSVAYWGRYECWYRNIPIVRTFVASQNLDCESARNGFRFGQRNVCLFTMFDPKLLTVCMEVWQLPLTSMK